MIIIVNPQVWEPMWWGDTKTISMKKALREMQTLHAGCSKAEPKNFVPPQTPSRGHRTAKV